MGAAWDVFSRSGECVQFWGRCVQFSGECVQFSAARVPPHGPLWQAQSRLSRDAGMMVGAGGRRGGAHPGMCQLCRANVSRFWLDVSTFRPNVSSFRPDVFTLAGQVFSFGSGASPRFRRLRGGMTRGKWLVGGGECLVTRAGVGLGGVGGCTGAGDGECWQ